MKENEQYKGVYCGLCHQMAQEYGLLARFILSFDFTFLSILALSIHKDFAGFHNHRCAFNPLKKKSCQRPCAELSYSAALAMMMFYYKIKDNQQDIGFFERVGGLLLLPIAQLARKKAMKKYPQMDQIMSRCMKHQLILEQAQCNSIDQAAHPTAEALGEITASFAEDKTEQLILTRFGYLVGKYVYLMDATDDWAQDYKTGNYNVFVLQFGADRRAFLKTATHNLNLIVAEIAHTYELLSLKRFGGILDNIIYIGLHHNIDTVIAKYTTDTIKNPLEKR